MQLTIWTHWQGGEWTGELDGVRDGAPVGEVLEYVFRWFNAVDEGDRERMLAVGYDLPSLSVGDVVTFADGTRWQCSPLGWELLEPVRNADGECLACGYMEPGDPPRCGNCGAGVPTT
jgi:hypothetical protein